MGTRHATVDAVSRWVTLISILVLWGAVSPPAALRAQSASDRVAVDPRVGVAFPVGALADVNEFGAAGGLGLAYYFHPHIAVRGDVALSVLDDRSPAPGTVLAPTLSLFHFNGGIQFDFPRSKFQDAPLSFRWNLGFGGTRMSATRDFPSGEDVDFQHTYVTLNSGGKIGWEFTETVTAFVGGEAYLIFADEEETAELVKRAPAAEPFGASWAVPLTLGVELEFR